MRNRTRHGRVLLTLLLTLGLIAAACSSDDASTTPDNGVAEQASVAEIEDQPDEPIEPDEPMEPVTLAVSLWKGGGTEVANVPELHDKFMEENPDIVIEFEYNGRGDHETANNTKLAAGEAADVIMVDEGLMNRWGGEGLLEDLSAESWVNNILPTVAPFTQIDGATYQFPQELVPIGVFANNALLAEAGINELPQTWTEFVASLEALEAAGTNGLLLPGGEWGGYQLLALSAAGTVYRDNPDWSQDYKDGIVSFNPDWAPAFGRLQELLQSGLVDGQLMASNLGGQPFWDGEWAYIITGAWEFGALVQAGLDFSFMPLPSDDAPRGFIFVGTGLAINSSSEVKDAARRYIDFWSRPENLVRYTEGENALTTVSNGLISFVEQSAPWAAAVDAGNWTFAPPQTLGPPNQEGEFYPLVGQVYQDPEADIGGLLDQLDAVIQPN